MTWEPLATEVFHEFHSTFRRDNATIFQVCGKCGGACEKSKIGTLIPGEKDYMARQLGLLVSEFSARYLDVIDLGGGRRVDVLRMVDGCPFLSRETFECLCRAIKPIMCEIYPVVFEVEQDVRFFLDTWCPLTDTACFRSHFAKNAIPLVQAMPIPRSWFEAVQEYDHLYFDYAAIEKARTSRESLEVFKLEDLMQLQCDSFSVEPKERWSPPEVA